MFKKVFAHWTKSKNPDSKRYRYDMAQKICGHHIKYVTERHADDVEEVIGKNGGLNIRDDEFIVFASGIVVFRADVDELTASELMSGDGVILTAHDLEHNGEYRSVVAYYSYYRK